MGAIIASGVCCCFACCCSQIFIALKLLIGVERVTKLYYLFLVVVFSVPTIMILFFLNRWQGFLDYFKWLTCPNGDSQRFGCIGPSSVYRISLSFLVLFLFMLLFMLCRNRLSMVVNQGLFCIKYLLIFCLFTTFLFVSNSVFDIYAIASKYISILFMIIQSIILIDLFYLAGIKLVKRSNVGDTSCKRALIILSVIFGAIAIGLNALGYIYFSSTDNCGNSLWVNIVCSSLLVIMPIFQFLNFNPQNSLLTTALVSTYVSYLAFICQFSFGGSHCKTRMTVGSFAADITVSTIFFFLAMYGSVMGGSGQVKITRNGDLNKSVGVALTQPLEPEHSIILNQSRNSQNQNFESQASNLLKYTQSWRWVKWHFYMCFASIYIGMLITNWTSASIITGSLISNDFGFWVRAAISWATTLLYIWTLIAPRICSRCDFNVV